ncbi:hypothetical protein [Agromyces larvae]|uniref:Uncharacterized protein n=1 Tax=Agromyces larvae TaxID=2929802 RepID=A0ABY4C9S6_9MICO|nr:hypothetical protein [Agromyces larvae]UOE45430.1 hypothetical protein MTO99_06635 [Agromyces larvae]
MLDHSVAAADGELLEAHSAVPGNDDLPRGGLVRLEGRETEASRLRPAANLFEPEFDAFGDRVARSESAAAAGTEAGGLPLEVRARLFFGVAARAQPLQGAAVVSGRSAGLIATAGEARDADRAELAG